MKNELWVRNLVLRGLTWDAQMRQTGYRTHIRRRDARVTPLPARWCCVHFFSFFLFPDSRRFTLTRLKLGPIRADSGHFGRNRQNTPIPMPNQPIQAEIQKEKGGGDVLWYGGDVRVKKMLVLMKHECISGCGYGKV